MKEKIAESKRIAAKEKAAMTYNSDALDLTVTTPSSNIRWGTRK